MDGGLGSWDWILIMETAKRKCRTRNKGRGTGKHLRRGRKLGDLGQIGGMRI
jgi:hypothetical protein